MRPRTEARPRLLVVSYHFSPGRTVGGLRWFGLTKYLARRGWEVRVVSSQPPPEGLEDGVHVHTCTPSVTLGDRYREWKRGVVSRRPAPEGTDVDPIAQPDPAAASVLGRIRREAGGLLAFPDEGRGWVVKATRRARALVRSFDPHVVVTSGPPHSAHLAGHFAVRGKGVPWLADLRDPWSDVDFLPPGSMRGLDVLERWVLRRTSGVITTTDELRSLLDTRHPGLHTHWLPNGVDLEVLPGTTANGPPLPGLSLSHVGALYGGREPGALLDAFREFLELHPDAAREGSRLRFVGPADGHYRARIERAMADGMGPYTEVIDKLPRDEALDLLARSRLAVVLAQGQELMVPAKLYESVALGLPTLVVTERGSSSHHAAERLGVFAADPREEGALVGVLVRVWEQVRAGSPPSPGPVPAIGYDVLAADMERVLLGAGRSTPEPPRFRRRNPSG